MPAAFHLNLEHPDHQVRYQTFYNPAHHFHTKKDRKYLDDLKTAIKSSKDAHDALTDKQQSLQHQLVSGEWLDCPVNGIDLGLPTYFLDT